MTQEKTKFKRQSKSFYHWLIKIQNIHYHKVDSLIINTKKQKT